MFYPNTPQFVEFGVGPAAPAGWHGVDVPDGDAYPFLQAPIGSEYWYVVGETHVAKYVKVKNDGADNDWCVVAGVISETVTIADFTDGGAAVGTVALSTQIPAGAFVTRAYLLDVTGFTGNTSAVITVGDGTDVDRYNTGTPNVFATAAAIDLAAPSGVQIHTTAKTVTLTVTSASDFTSVTAGQLTIRIFYTK